MSFDVNRVRSDTPATATIAHLNNCGASLPPAAVTEAVCRHIQLEATLGPYEAAAVAEDQATALYLNAARILGCQPEDIAYCDSASRAWNVLVYSLRLKPRDRVWISTLEFGSALVSVQNAAERCGATVEVIPCDSHGRVSLESLQEMLSHAAPTVVAVNHAAAHSGAVNPVAEIGRLVKATGAWYLVDACQSLGQMAVSVDDVQCDGLVVTGRKWLRGPRGTGFVYARPELAAASDSVTSDLVTADYLFDPDPTTGSRVAIRRDARRFELWERSIAGAIGLGVALDYLINVTSGAFEAYQRIISLAQYAADGLRGISGVQVWAPELAQSGIVGFVVDGISPEAVKQDCARSSINISTMADYDAPLDFRRRGSSVVCRIGPHYYNDYGEIDRFIQVVRQVR